MRTGCPLCHNRPRRQCLYCGRMEPERRRLLAGALRKPRPSFACPHRGQMQATSADKPCWMVGHHMVGGVCERCGHRTDPLAWVRELFPQIGPAQLAEIEAILIQLAEVREMLVGLEVLRLHAHPSPLSPYRPIPQRPVKPVRPLPQSPCRPIPLYPNPYGTATAAAQGSSGPTPINGGLCV